VCVCVCVVCVCVCVRVIVCVCTCVCVCVCVIVCVCTCVCVCVCMCVRMTYLLKPIVRLYRTNTPFVKRTCCCNKSTSKEPDVREERENDGRVRQKICALAAFQHIDLERKFTYRYVFTCNEYLGVLYLCAAPCVRRTIFTHKTYFDFVYVPKSWYIYIRYIGARHVRVTIHAHTCVYTYDIHTRT